MTKPLSICIPTYNRGPLLDEALGSIASQPQRNAVQIVVSDNASTDNTIHVVEKWRSIFPDMIFHRWPKNQGADLNFIKAVELGTGRWRWLLGSDDQLAPGAIDSLLLTLRSNPDIVLLDYTLMSFDMQKKLHDRHVLDAPENSVFQLKSCSDFADFLARATELSSLFAYISTLVIRADAWNAAPMRDEFIGSAWIHVTKALDIFSRGGTLCYPRSPLIYNRSGNDSFLATVGFTRRALIDLDYVRIAHRVLADKPGFDKAMYKWLEQRFFSWSMILAIKRSVSISSSPEEAKEFELRLFEAFAESRFSLMKQFLWRMAPLPLLNVLRDLARLIR